MTKLYASAGEHLFCESGHEAGVVLADIAFGHVVSASNVRIFGSEVIGSKPVPRCQTCRAGICFSYGRVGSGLYFREGFRIADEVTGEVWHVKRHPERVIPHAPWPRDAA